VAPELQLGAVSVEVTFKDIKNVHLSVYPPVGRVRISAPARMSLDTVRVFAISKLEWIKQQQRKLQDQQRETPREYLEQESHYLWGRRYLMDIVEADDSPTVEVRHRRLRLSVRPGTNPEGMQDVFARWYREQVRAAAPVLIEKWSPLLGVTVELLHVQQMKTKWGSCNPSARSIRLNTELAKKPRECLD
jgi:predicted metal-dependent hydrolase